MKKHANRLIALLVLLAMLLGTCYATELPLDEGGNNEVPAASQSSEPVSTSGTTGDPLVSISPDTTPDPDTITDPEASASPDASTDPEASAEPEASTDPEASTEPDASVEPVVSSSPEASDDPYGIMLLDDEEEEEDGLNGTTEPVDNSTTLADGIYVPEGFSFSGGTGKTKITCDQVRVSGGKSYATIAFSSSSYAYVKASGGKYLASIVDGKSTFEIPVALNRNNTIIGMTTAMSTQKEIEYAICVTLTESQAPTEPETPAEPETPDGDETSVEDGEYDTPVDSSSSMFKVVACKLTAKDGKYTATITLSGTGYDLLYLGTAEAAVAADASDCIPFVADAEGKYTFTFPVEKLDAPIAIAAHSISKDTWYDRTLTFKSEGMEKVEVPIEDGEYDTPVDSSSSMFKVVACKLTARDGKYTATITLSGTGYDLLYLGTAEAAVAADVSDCIPFVADAEGKYTFTFPVEKLDAPINIAAHSISKDTWYDRTLTFRSEGMEKIEPSEPTATPVPTATPTPAPTETPEADLSGSTSRVDSSTTLADGAYTPDKFSFSGGTGKVKITCPKVTVSGGKAKATLVFDSPNYSYIKANGSKYYGSHSGNSSTFEIPVKLNANNRIIGMTTAMSQDHEVEYTIYIYLKAAESSSAAADTDAPEIVGLTYEATETIENAELFSIYRYEGGFTVIEVADAGRYLLIPEGAEVPTGLEEDATLIQLPVQAAYVATESAMALIDGIEIDAEADPVKLSGCEGLALNRMASEQLSFAGAWNAPDYTALLMNGCDLAILPEAFSDAETVAEEDRAAAAEVAGRLELLGIPAFVDRSAAEETELGRLEWIRIYGALLGCEDAANAAYAAAVAALDAEAA